MMEPVQEKPPCFQAQQLGPTNGYLEKFKLFKTASCFYMIGRDKDRTFWRVLKIDRLEPAELNIFEDPATYSEHECCNMLKRLHEGNKSSGGLKFVTTCYGIVGFVKFLGPHYMLLIKERKEIGDICGHLIYSITKSELIPVPNSTVLSSLPISKNDNRYKKLLCAVDLRKDFFFSYSYHIMQSLQKNVCDTTAGTFLYETMFVWNEFLTRGIRSYLNNYLWTVALVHGFFKQDKFSISGRDFIFTIVARRSRHYAGPRYLKRGLNKKGQVANDVETEQIVVEDAPEGFPVQISSVVQNRGSIPLFWSQETSRFVIQPDIKLWRKDHNYDTTRLHFENLVRRYGNPIIILNLIKTQEKKPRESILRAEFANAIEIINKDLTKENRLRFLHWDLKENSKNKSISVLNFLNNLAAFALELTGIFYCRISPTSWPEDSLNRSKFEKSQDLYSSQDSCYKIEDDGNLEWENSNGIKFADGNCSRPPCFQNGVLRTNCIDCLDRTNVAQCAYGLVALAHQLHALGFLDGPTMDMNGPMANDLMKIYETMGDTLALQYGGSAAHNKIFSKRRGQWNAATQSQEFFRTLQRYFSNVYMDADKQDAINVFLGHFQLQEVKQSLWEPHSNQHYNVDCRSPHSAEENSILILEKLLTTGSLLSESNSPTGATIIKLDKTADKPFDYNILGANRVLPNLTPVISNCESNVSYYRQLFNLQQDQYVENDHLCVSKHRNSFDFSNFVDVEWLSSSGNLCEEETFERSMLINSRTAGLSANDAVNELKGTTSASEAGSSVKGGGPYNEVLSEFSNSFVNCVTYGKIWFP